MKLKKIIITLAVAACTFTCMGVSTVPTEQTVITAEAATTSKSKVISAYRKIIKSPSKYIKSDSKIKSTKYAIVDMTGKGIPALLIEATYKSSASDPVGNTVEVFQYNASKNKVVHAKECIGYDAYSWEPITKRTDGPGVIEKDFFRMTGETDIAYVTYSGGHLRYNSKGSFGNVPKKYNGSKITWSKSSSLGLLNKLKVK